MFSLVLAAAQSVLTVFAASSLYAAFPELGKSFEATHPGVEVRFDFNGSQILEAQLVQGAQADVFASADQRWMERAVSDGVAAAPVAFASNNLVVVASSSSTIVCLSDLTRSGVRLVLCAEVAPCGRYARLTLRNMDADAVAKGFSSAVLRNLVSEETDVEAVLAKVSLGEADAGIVYRSDVARVQNKNLRVIELPVSDQPAIIYPIAAIRASKSPALATDFISFVRSHQGQEILRRFGLTPSP